MIKRLSRKAEVQPLVAESDVEITITLRVAAAKAWFLSTQTWKREVPAALMLMQEEEQSSKACLSSRIEAYNIELQSWQSIAAEVVSLVDASQYFFKFLKPLRDRSPRSKPLFDWGADSGVDADVMGDRQRPTPDDWRMENLVVIAARLRESNPKRFDRVGQDLDGRYNQLAGFIQHVWEEKARLESQLRALERRIALDHHERLVAIVDQQLLLEIMGEVVDLTRQDGRADYEYALYGGAVWACERALSTVQWRTLTDDFLVREEAEFARVLASPRKVEDSDSRERIPTQVRTAVWNRDKGRCVQCGSRDRLEYDHIVPVSKGGSNTERNIELLCEACNRSKSSKIS